MNPKIRLAVAFAAGAATAIASVMLVAPRDRAPVTAPSTSLAAAASSRKLPAHAEKRDWPAVAVGTQTRATLSTKAENGTLFYRLLLSNLPPGGIELGREARIVIKLLDADRFAVAELEVDPRENTRHLDPDGRLVGYEWLGGAALPPETAALVREWTLSWSGIDEVAEPVITALDAAPAAVPEPRSTAMSPAAPPVTETASRAKTPDAAPPAVAADPATPPVRKRWQQKENWAKVTIGMSPQAVLLTLGVPTRRSNSLNMETWYYGDLENAGNVFFVTGGDGTRVKSVTLPRK